MLDNLRRAHRGPTLAFYLDIPLAETLHRHAQRPQATQFSADDMRGWYRQHDVLGFPDEHVIGPRSTHDDTVNLIFSRLPPAVHRRIQAVGRSQPAPPQPTE